MLLLTIFTFLLVLDL